MGMTDRINNDNKVTKTLAHLDIRVLVQKLDALLEAPHTAAQTSRDAHDNLAFLSLSLLLYVQQDGPNCLDHG